MVRDPYFEAREQARIEERTAFESGRIRQILQEEFWRGRSPAEDNALEMQDDALRLSEQKRPREAVREILKAYYLLPSNKEIGQNLLNLSNAYALQLIHGRLYEDACELLLVIRGLGLVDGLLHARLSSAYIWLGRSDEALEEISEAIRFQPSDAGNHQGLAHCYLLKALESSYVQKDSKEAKRWQMLSANSFGLACTLGGESYFKNLSWSLLFLQSPKFTPFNWFTWLMKGIQPFIKATHLSYHQLDVFDPLLDQVNEGQVKEYFDILVESVQNQNVKVLPDPRRVILTLGEGSQ